MAEGSAYTLRNCRCMQRRLASKVSAAELSYAELLAVDSFAQQARNRARSRYFIVHFMGRLPREAMNLAGLVQRQLARKYRHRKLPCSRPRKKPAS